MRRNTKGASLVSVITAFFILMILMILFQKSLQVSGNLLVRAQQLRQQAEEMAGVYYRQKQTAGANGEACSYTFSGANGSFQLKTRNSQCVSSDGQIVIHFFGDGGAELQSSQAGGGQ